MTLHADHTSHRYIQQGASGSTYAEGMLTRRQAAYEAEQAENQA